MQTLRRAAAAVVAILAFVPRAVSPAQDRLPVEVDAGRPLVAGTIRVTVERRAERLELLAAIDPQDSIEHDAAATSALARRLRAAFPTGTVTELPGTAIANRFTNVTGGPYGGFARVSLGAVPDDIALRSTIGATGANVVGIGAGFASCDAFAQRAADDARARAAAYVLALGIAAAPPVVHDATHAMHPIDGPANDVPLCGPDAHLVRPTAIARPVSATYALHATYAFAVPVRALRVRDHGPEETVPALWAGPFDGERFRLHADRALLTLEGHALAARHVDGTVYAYDSYAVRRATREDTVARLVEIRRRLRAIGIPDERIITESDLHARWNVTVRTPGEPFDERVVTAIAGPDVADRRAVLAAPYGPCAASPDDVARATADAARKAAEIAAALGGKADLAHPAAIVMAHSALGGCVEGANFPSLPEPVERHIAGGLAGRDALRAEAEDIMVLASFPIAGASLDGTGDAAPASDAEPSFAVRFGFAPPPFAYENGTRTGEARRERRLTPQRVRLSLELHPDAHNSFRPIDPHLGSTLAARLRVGERAYAASSIASTDNLPGGDPDPDGLRFTAVLPYRAEETARDVEAAQRIAGGAGYGMFDAVPQRDACAHAAMQLARDTIRAAAHDAHAPAGARLIAIDLRGPFTVEGLCRAGPGGPSNWSVRDAVIPDVRLAAYARVSYAP